MFKLWAVGESFGDPEEWSRWSEPVVVVARTAEEAIKIAGTHGPATEMPMDRPYVVMRSPPADCGMGDDI